MGLSEPEAAGQRALAIYNAVIERGWESVLRRYSREVTLAFHWGHDPLLWTYTTLHTSVGAGSESAGREGAHDIGSVQVIEEDPGVRLALRRCLQSDAVVKADRVIGRAARCQAAHGRTLLCLINRDLAGQGGLVSPGGIGELQKGIPALTYSLHADSEELFARTPGGISGYVLKRVMPTRILEPVEGALTDGRVPARSLAREARGYFQRLLDRDFAKEPSNVAARLTRREHDVLELLSKGYMDKRIAQALNISTWTVHEHVKRIFEKLQVHSRTEAVLACFQK